jgi:hypothetical protein
MTSETRHTRHLAGVAFVSLCADLLEVRCQSPHPPGTRVSIPFPSAVDEAVPDLTGKVTRVARGPAGTASLRIRLNSCTREQRQCLDRLLRPEG